MSLEQIKTILKKTYRVFSPYSKKYEVDFRRYLRSLSILATIPAIGDKKVLDIGTGIGIMPAALQKLGIRVIGIDRYIFPDAKNEMFGLPHIGELQKIWEAEGVKVLNADIYDVTLPQQVSGIDVILSEATIEHLKDPRRFLERCHKLLPKDGYLLVTTPNATTLIKRLRFLFGLSPYWPIEGFYKDGEGFTGHWREYTLPELRYMFEQAGFSVVKAFSRNDLTKFKTAGSIKKNIRAAIAFISGLIPGTGEMHYVLGKKV